MRRARPASLENVNVRTLILSSDLPLFDVAFLVFHQLPKFVSSRLDQHVRAITTLRTEAANSGFC
jgi:hypothetical protein